MDSITSLTCRLCCLIPGKYLIFDDYNELPISKKIMHCCPKLSIENNDGLPVYICKPCEEELSTFYCFVLKCEAADKKLRLLLANDCISNTDIIKTENTKEINELRNETFNKNDVLYIEQENKEDMLIYDDLLDTNEDVLKNHINAYSTTPTTYSTNKEAKLENQDVSHFINNDLCFLNKEEMLGNQNDSYYSEAPLLKRRFKMYKKKHKKVGRKRLGTCTCDVCGRQCPNPSSLEIHKRVHTNERPYSCTSCDKTFKDHSGLKRHVDRKHTGKRQRDVICDHCGKAFYSKCDVLIHMRTHTGETPYACDICSKKFSQLSTKLRHQKRHNAERNQICFTCNKTFCTKAELDTHHLVHSSVKKYSCTICNTLFKYKNNLKKHVRQHMEPNSFVCNYCSRTFNVKGNLKIHIDRQHSSKSGFCSVCLKQVANIESHLVLHTRERLLKCEYCSKTYFHKHALIRHTNLWHKHPDKFKCDVNNCSLSFPSQSMLDFHKVKHHGNIIPFPCDKCSRGFYRKNDLARHKIGTHKERLMNNQDPPLV